MQSLRNLLLLGGLPFAAATLRAVVGRREKSLVAVFCTLLSFSALAQDDEYAREAERAANLLDKAVAYYRERARPPWRPSAGRASSSITSFTSMSWIPTA